MIKLTGPIRVGLFSISVGLIFLTGTFPPTPAAYALQFESHNGALRTPLISSIDSVDALGRHKILGIDPKPKFSEDLEIVNLDPKAVLDRLKIDGKFLLPIGAATLEFNLTQRDLRSPDYYAEEQGGFAASRVLELQSVTTYKGSINGDKNSHARFSIDQYSITGMFWTRAGYFVIEPVRATAAYTSSKTYAIYRVDDEINSMVLKCPVKSNEVPTSIDLSSVRPVEASNSLLTVRIATEADNEYVNSHGGPLRANNDILSVLNVVEGIYEAELGITFQVVYQSAWSAPDPYAGATMGDVLNQFRDYWNENRSGVSRDLAHMWTGRFFSDAGGLAWQGVTCSPIYPGLRYGINSIYGTPIQYAYSAHEIAHQLGTSHADGVDSCQRTIMNGSDGSPSQLTFCQYSRNEVITYLDSQPSCLSLLQGLAAWWPADGSSVDASGNGNDVIGFGNYEQGRVGPYSFYFYGNGNYAQVGSNPGLRMTNGLTMSAWIYPTGPGSSSTYGGTVMSREGEYLFQRYQDGTVWWAVAQSQPLQFYRVNTGFVAPLNTWSHIVLVYDGTTRTMKTYANGSLVNVDTGAPTFIADESPAENDFRLGGRQGASHYYQGRIDEAHVFNRAITAREACALYTEGTGLPCSNPGVIQFDAANYNVNENAGTVTLTLSRANGSDGTVSVDYSTVAEGSATPNVDYTASSGTITFGPGVTSRSFTVPIIDDSLVEGNETFFVLLNNPTGGAAVGSPRSASATIVDNDNVPPVAVTIQTQPSGLQFMVSGTAYTAPQTFNWAPGSVHTISTVSPQSGPAGTRFVWSSWSDSQPISHDVTTPNLNTTYTAFFGTQYQVSVSTNSSGGTVSPAGTTWADAGQSITIQATPNSGYKFVNWTGNGNGSYSGASNPASITVGGPISEAASFAQCSYLINPSTAFFYTVGGSGSFSVMTDSGCAWSAMSGVGWVGIQGATSGVGNGTVNYAVESNAQVGPRGGNITVNGQQHAITQAGIGSIEYVSFSSSSNQAGEGAGTIQITVNRGPSNGRSFVVNYTSSGGTATPNIDYVPVSGSLSFGPNDTTKTISVPIIDDGVSESNENFNISLVSNPSEDVIVRSPSTTTVTIVDNDNLPTRIAPFDFDGDGKTDVGVFRPGAAEWWITRSSNGSVIAAQFGSAGDVAVPADFTGDGKEDIAFFRPSTGTWYVLRSEDGSFYGVPFGNATDIAAPADYDGDGKADLGVFRESTGVWWYASSANGGLHRAAQFGQTGDKPVPADYDGDGTADFAIFRPNGATGGEWWILRSSAGVLAASFGSSTDKTVVGDWTGDGKADCAFFRPSNGTWYVLRSDDFSFYGFPFGVSTDTPAPGDYDGDGKMDAAVFRSPGAAWYINNSSGGVTSLSFGAAGDVPIASFFVR